MLEKRYLLSQIAVTLLASLAVANVPVQAPPPVVRIYVNMPLGYIPGVPPGPLPGSLVFVDLYIETDIIDNTPQGIVQWAISVKVDPTVLEPVGVQGAQPGYFLYDFALSHGRDVILWPPTIDKGAGTMEWIGEEIAGQPPIQVGAGSLPGWPCKLVTLVYKSLSETAYSPIDLYYEIGVDAWYWTAESGTEAIPVDVVEDGQYNLPSPSPLPEFPLGSVAPIALIVAIAYLWLMKKRERPKVMCSRKKR